MRNLAVKIYFMFCVLICCLIAFANFKGIYLLENQIAEIKVTLPD
jgi:hypothetical protein